MSELLKVWKNANSKAREVIIKSVMVDLNVKVIHLIMYWKTAVKVSV